MEGTLTTVGGAIQPAERSSIEGLLAEKAFFWLDVEELDADVMACFRDVLGFHPLSVEDVEHFGQRPKFEEYDNFLFLVVYGSGTTQADPVKPFTPPDLIEVHCFYSEHYLVTVHRGPHRGMADLRRRLCERRGPLPSPVLVLHRVIDMLVDSFFPVLSQMDDDIDDLEDRILEKPTDDQLGTLFQMKRALMAIRKIITPERDMFASMLSGAVSVSGIDLDTERYFRDIYDHLIRLSDLVDSYRDLLTGAMDTHLSTVSNRLNAVMKQLTIIATVFLPLTFITGFFGQNFGWLVSRLSSFPIFLAAGVGLQVVAAVGLLRSFRTRGWL